MNQSFLPNEHHIHHHHRRMSIRAWSMSERMR